MAAAKNPHGLQIWDLLIELIWGLSPSQAEKLYSELLPRYSRRAQAKYYNEKGELDLENGLVKLTELQYRALRTKYGDTYITKAFTELTSYIKYMQQHPDKYKSKLKQYQSGTHNIFLTPKGWVYEKCKAYTCSERPQVNVNPYLIDDINTAKEYIKMIPPSVRKDSIDVQALLLKFPELLDVDYEG